MMTIKFPIVILCGLACVSVLVSAYGQGSKVPAAQCQLVVEHVKHIHGLRSPSQSSMIAKCRIASDKQRGCLMASTTPKQLNHCFA